MVYWRIQMNQLAECGVLTFCQTLMENLTQEVRPMKGNHRSLYSDARESCFTVWVPNPETPDDVIDDVVYAAEFMAKRLNEFHGPLQFYTPQHPPLGVIVHNIRMNSISVQQYIGYDSSEGKTYYKFLVKFRTALPPLKPIKEYENELVAMAELSKSFEKLHVEFDKQPWTKAILAQRKIDNKAKMPLQGRTYEVTHVHIHQLMAVGLNCKRFGGYDLIEVPEEKYMRDHFSDLVT